MKARFLALLLVLTCAVAFSQPGPRNAPKLPEGTKALRNVAYVTNGHERHKLDLFIPVGATNALPLIIWVHGGAWMGGSKEQCPALPYLQKGYAVASINYRLSQHAIFPAQLEDCKAAVRWLRANAKEFNLDPNRFAAWGASAGGHLVALLGTAGDAKKFDVGANLEVSSRVQAVVDFFGPTDLTRMAQDALPGSRIDHDAPDAAEAKLIGGPVQQNKDDIVPYQQSELLRDALQKAGVPVTFKIVEGAGHGFGGPDIDRQVAAFFEQHLKPNVISK